MPAHVADALNLAGLVVSTLGALYVTYDLLGGRQGPLRWLTRAISYAVVFGLGYGAVLGLAFGLVAGPLLATILALEFRRVAIHRAHVHGLDYQQRTLLFGAARGVSLGLASAVKWDVRFGACFGLLSAVALMAVYTLRLSPSQILRISVKPVLTPDMAAATVAWGLAIGAAGAASAWLSPEVGLSPLKGAGIGLLSTVVSTAVGSFAPSVEWWADNLPARRLGVCGVILGLFGFMVLAIVPVCSLLSHPLP